MQPNATGNHSFSFKVLKGDQQPVADQRVDLWVEDPGFSELQRGALFCTTDENGVCKTKDVPASTRVPQLFVGTLVPACTKPLMPLLPQEAQVVEVDVIITRDIQ